MLSIRERRQRRQRVPGPGFASTRFVPPQYPVIVSTLILALMLVELLSRPAVHHSLPVERSVSQYAVSLPEAERFDAMRLTITRDGTFYFRNFRVSEGDLANVIHQSVQDGAQRKVFLVVDQRARYGDVERGLDQVRSAGIAEVAFLTEVPFLHK